MFFSENDIRPKDLEAGKLNALQSDLSRLKQHINEFVPVNCPACGSSENSHEFSKFGFNFDRCVKCYTVYMNPRATPSILADFYAHSILYEYWNNYIFPATRSARQERIFRPRVDRILDLCAKLKIGTDVLIEVGAAGGMFCEEAKRSGKFKRVIGIEPGSAQAETCRSLGIEIIESTLEQVGTIATLAQVVASFETLEHVFSPKEFLMHCHRLLEPQGILYLTCPNYQGFDIMTLGSISESLDAEHINMFNPSSLKCLVESLGFEVIEISTPGELDADIVRSKILDGSFDIFSQPFLRQVLVDHWDRLGPPFQTFLKTNLLSSHMCLVARKLPND